MSRSRKWRRAYGEATPLRLAANAVMAGCAPNYFPLFMLAIEAMCEEPFNLYGVQATTHLCAPLVIVNGPVALELGINSGHNAFGPGTAQQRNDRPRHPACARQYRRRDSDAGRHVDFRRAVEIQLSRRGKRGGEPVGTAACRARLCQGSEHGDRRRRRVSAQRQRPRKHQRRRHPHDDRRHHGHRGFERYLLRRATGGGNGPRARPDDCQRRLQQSRRQALPATARDPAARQVLEGEHRAPTSRVTFKEKYANAGLDAPVFACRTPRTSSLR